jgi:hypothetical protein
MATYITKDDYFNFAGIDLAIELRKANTDNPSKAVDIFLARVEDWCMDYLKQHYFFEPEEFHAEQFKKGVLHQIDYIRTNGDMSLDAANMLSKLAPNAFRQFQLGGMTNCSKTVPQSIFTKYGY